MIFFFFYWRGFCVIKLFFVDLVKRKFICFVLYFFRFLFKSLGLIVLCECIVGFFKIKYFGGNKKIFIRIIFYECVVMLVFN